MALFPHPLREATVQRFGAFRALWWDVGTHGGGPFSTPGVELEVIRGLSLPRGALDGVDVVIAETHDIRREEIRRSLALVLKARGRPPVLLLTSSHPDNLRFLNHLSVEDLAWAFEPVEEVLARGTERRRVAEYLLRSCSDRVPVESVVRKLFLDPKAPSLVQGLAKACFVTRRTLEKRWKAAWPSTAPISLKALVDWALALRAMELHQAGLPPNETAKALGIHRRTLDRIADRLAGFPWGKWLASESQVVWRGMAGRILNKREKERVLSNK